MRVMGNAAHRGVDGAFDRRRLDRRHAGDRHAGHRARAAQHDRPVRRRERLVGAARLGRAHQHLGQGQVPVGAGADRLVVGQQQGVRSAVRARQPVRARQAATAGRAPRHHRFGRRHRLPRPVAVRDVDLLAAAVVHPARRVPRVRQHQPARADRDPRDSPGFVRVRTQRSASPGSAGSRRRWPGGSRRSISASHVRADEPNVVAAARVGCRRDRRGQGVADVRLPGARVRGHAWRRARRGVEVGRPALRRRLQILARGRELGTRHQAVQGPQLRLLRLRRGSGTTCRSRRR